MKKACLWLLCGICGTVLVGCSEDTSSAGSSVEVRTQLGTATVRSAALLERAPQGRSGVDSLRIDSVRVLIRRLKLHAAGEDTSAGGRDIKVGPAVALFGEQPQLLSAADIPAGTYRWLKLEFHRFSDSEASRYATDTLFQDFAAPDRPSVIIAGVVFVGDSAVPFVYRSQLTANVSLALDPPASVGTAELVRLLVRFEPLQAFLEGNTVLDPRDPRFRSTIETKLRSALKALKQSP